MKSLDPAVARDLAALDDALAGRAVGGEHRDIERLVAAVRSDAAVPGPRLARLVADRDTQRPSRARRLWVGGGAGATALAGLLAILVAGGSSRHADQISVPDGGRASREAAPALSSSAAPPAVAPESTPAAPGAARDVQRDISITLLAARGKLADVSDHVVATTDAFGGTVQSSNVSTADQGGGTAEFQLLVPQARLAPALAALSRLAHVSSRTDGSQDVTDSVAALRRRLEASQAERRGLLRQLAGATSPTRLAAIRAQLKLAGERISRESAELDRMLRTVRFATVAVTINESAKDQLGGAWNLGDASADALRVLEVALGIAIVGLAALVPLALLGAGGRLVLRHRRESVLG